MSGPAIAARAASRGTQPLGDQLAGRDQHARRRHLRNPPVSSRRIAWPSRTRLGGALVVDACLVDEDLLLHIRCGETEVDGDHPLTCGVLEVLQHALVAGVVGHHQRQKPGAASSVTPSRSMGSCRRWSDERVQHHRGVLTCLHHLVEIADGAVAHRTSQRAVDPFGVAAAQQEAADEVGGGQVVVAGDRDERPAQIVRHRLDEPASYRIRSALSARRTSPGGRRP